MFKTDQLIEDTMPPVKTNVQGLTFPRHFVKTGIHPFDTVKWTKRDARITTPDGRIIFEQLGVEFPEQWSQTAVDIVSQKYFRGMLGTTQREYSLKQMVLRVVDTITNHGLKEKYFDEENGRIFHNELCYLLIHQYASFNSPVWFNIGVPNNIQQASACFILDVEDNMESILNWFVEEGRIFSSGSGSGTNISKIRSKLEFLSGGGRPSGPMSFNKVADKSGSIIKSGGKTRRAARLIILDVDHPDIKEFIWCKVLEEKKAYVLAAGGYDDGIDGEIYQTLDYQNANHSVGAYNEWMDLVKRGGESVVFTRYRTTGKVASTYKAAELFHEIAEAAHKCADPGLYFPDTVNAWHTCPNTDKIYGANPCIEYVFLNNTACNLASHNLVKYLKPDGSFDSKSFCQAVDILITAQEILVGYAEYPTQKITENSHKFRTLGLGYNNLGGLLMLKGFPYDSDEGRRYAASITALMTGRAYKQSANIAKVMEPFDGFVENRDAMLSIIHKHLDAIPLENHGPLPDADIWMLANNTWVEAVNLGWQYGYRNAQVTLLQPGGTVSFMMDCQTTGVEPDVALVKYKKLSGGGTIKGVNNLVPLTLKNLGYFERHSEYQVENMVRQIETFGSVEDTNLILPEHLSVFDCAFPTKPGGRSIPWEAHIKMVAAVQPFLSGSVSKTINMPNSSTVEDVERAYMMAWELGLKSISIYRDGCKFQQPVTTQQDDVKLKEAMSNGVGSPQAFSAFVDLASSLVAQPQRRRLPDERPSLTHKFTLGGQAEGYLTIGLYSDGQPGELFLKMAKEGSTISGLVDAFATCVSIMLQYGVPLKAIVDKFSHTRFEPAGFTQNSEIPMASSVIDYVVRYLATKFLKGSVPVQIVEHTGVLAPSTAVEYSGNSVPVAPTYTLDAPVCSECGSLCLRQAGNCHVCEVCGGTSGCS